MRKEKEVLELYGCDFLVIHPKNSSYIPPMNYASLWTAYENPSFAKQRIWYYWKSWFDRVKRDNNGGDIYITSRNSSFFSIGGYIDSPIGERWAFRITYTRQECWKVCNI